MRIEFINKHGKDAALPTNRLNADSLGFVINDKGQVLEVYEGLVSGQLYFEIRADIVFKVHED